MSITMVVVMPMVMMRPRLGADRGDKQQRDSDDELLHDVPPWLIRQNDDAVRLALPDLLSLFKFPIEIRVFGLRSPLAVKRHPLDAVV